MKTIGETPRSLVWGDHAADATPLGPSRKCGCSMTTGEAALLIIAHVLSGIMLANVFLVSLGGPETPPYTWARSTLNSAKRAYWINAGSFAICLTLDAFYLHKLSDLLLTVFGVFLCTQVYWIVALLKFVTKGPDKIIEEL